jgi:chromosome partitioning protein
MRKIAVINQKGGVGKTTTTVNLGSALARAGKPVVLIDLDPQAHLTLHYGLEPRADIPNIYQVLAGTASLEEVVKSPGENIQIAPSNIDLAAAEVELASVVGREVILRDAIDEYTKPYDFILMDCPPSLGILTINALCAATEVFITLQPHFLALQGMGKLLETINIVAKRINRNLKVSGVILCMYETGTKLANEVVADMEHFFTEAHGHASPWAHTTIFTTRIRRNIKLAEAPSFGQEIFTYAPASNGAEDYAALAREVLKMTGEKPQPQPSPAISGEPDHEPAVPPPCVQIPQTDRSPVSDTGPDLNPSTPPEPCPGPAGQG